MSMQQTSSNRYEAGGIAFVGALLIGLGLGFFFDEVVVGLLLGLGVGFLALAAFRAAAD